MPAKADAKKRTPRKKKSAVQDILAILVVDRSGSMGGLENAVVEGVNDYIQQLRGDETPGEIFVSITTFDTEVDHLNVATALADVQPITRQQIQPRGGTALFDAIANSIVDGDKKLKELGRDEIKVLHVTVTDGGENSSQEYAAQNGGQERLAALVKSYEDKGTWTFVYLGMGFQIGESIRASSAMGYSAGNTMSSTHSGGGTRTMMANLASVTSARKTSPMTATDSAFADAGQDLTNYDLDGSLGTSAPAKSTLVPEKGDLLDILGN